MDEVLGDNLLRQIINCFVLSIRELLQPEADQINGRLLTWKLLSNREGMRILIMQVFFH